MKPYDQLTRLGKIRRQRQIVMAALQDYDLAVKSVKFLADHTNTLFQVNCVDGARYALRIYSDGETTLKENRAEMFWLNALKRETDLKITEPIARKDGTYLTVINLPGVPPDQRCAVFSWVPGQALEETAGAMNTENYFKYGEALAKLHNHSESLNPLPADISPKKWDKVFYYASEPIVYNDAAYAHLYTAEQIALLDEVIAIADPLLMGMFRDPAGQQLLHGDLHYWNVHVYKNELYLIDFEDLNLGYDVQDVAITFYYGRDLENKPALEAAFKEGYSSLRRWPVESDKQLQTLIAARMVMFTNYVGHMLDEADAREFIAARCVELKDFLARYKS